MQLHAERQIAAWLFVCCFAVFLMIVVGGVTRLTHSGLSIVEWQPIVGTVPPMTDQQWQETAGIRTGGGWAGEYPGRFGVRRRCFGAVSESPKRLPA